MCLFKIFLKLSALALVTASYYFQEFKRGREKLNDDGQRAVKVYENATLKILYYY